MAAAKTASETASLRDLSQEIQRASIKARAELDDVRRRLDELRSEREAILSAPLHRDDLASELKRHIEKKARDAVWFLRGSLQELRDKSPAMATTDPDGQASYHPFDKAWLPEIVAILAEPEAAVDRILKAAGDDLDHSVPEGLPLAQRRAAVHALDEKIRAAEDHESALVEGLQAAGISLPLAA